MKRLPASSLPRPQRGVAALAVSLVLLFIMTVAVFFMNRGLIAEQKTSANQTRSTSAFELAEAGVEWAIGMLNDPRKIDTACIANETLTQSFRQRYLAPGYTATRPVLADFAVPADSVAACRLSASGALSCSCPAPGGALSFPTTTSINDRSFTVRFSRRPSGTEAVDVEAQGCVNPNNTLCTANAGEGTALVRATLKLKPAIRAIPPAPITAGGSVQICQNYRVTNTDAESLGTLINAGVHIQVGQVYKSGETGMSVCNITGGTTQQSLPGSPWQNAMIPQDQTLVDVSASDSGLFAAHFGVSLAHYKSEAFIVAGGTPTDRAAALRAAYKKGYRNFWVEGDIQFTQNDPVGSPSEPITLVGLGAVIMRGNAALYGLVYSASYDWESLNGGSSDIVGALIMRGNFRGGSAGSITYDPSVLLHYRSLSGSMIRVPGSWRDF